MASNQQAPAQAQMKRESHDSLVDQSSQSSFLQETGDNVKTMTQGVADVGKGAALGAVSLAKGAAMGAANVAQGAADAVKNTFGGAGGPTLQNSKSDSGHNYTPANERN